jgi:outer membrane protein insertion porin family
VPAPRLTSLLRSLALAAPLAATAAEPSFVVKDVKLEGERHVSEERIRFLLEVRQGKTYTATQLKEAIADDVHAIQAMGPFTDTRSDMRYGDDPREVTVVYRFRELPYVAKVEIDGLDYFDHEKANKVVTTKAGSYLNELLLENDRRALERTFQEKGDRWCHARVETVEDHGNTTVVFSVLLGTEVKVGRIDYVGLPEGARPMVIDRALLMPRGSPYQPELVDFDARAVVRKLQDLGWLDAKLIEVRRESMDYVRPVEERSRHGPTLAPDALYNDRMAITYVVEPGPRYRLGKVSFVDNTIATQEQLRAAFGMPEGAWFKHDDLYGEPRPGGDKGAIERSRRVMSNQGYARVALGVDRHLDLTNHIVDLVLHVVHEDNQRRQLPGEGTKYRIGRVDVRGNEHTRDAVVRRAMFLHPGDAWNDDRKDESLDQVRRTGVFKSGPPRPLTVEPEFPDDRPEEADLVVAVDEDATGSLNFQIGYSTATKIFGQVGYTERNFDLLGLVTGGIDHFRGASQILDFSAQWSKPAKAVTATWTNQHVLDGPYSLSVSGSRVDSSLREWTERRITTTATVGRYFLNNRLNLNLGYSYTDLKVKDIQTNAPSDALPGYYYLNTWSLGQSYDHLSPDRANPTSGFFLSTSEAVTGDPMKSSSDYFEYGAKGDGFLPVDQFEDGGVTYFHLSAHWREQDPTGDSAIIPFYQRYRDGGPSPRHRGFDYDELSPQEINANGALARTGGTKAALTTLEFSVPVQGTNEGIRALTFVDVGNVWAQQASVDFKDLRTAVGFGVRFPIQIPVMLDFAWLINPGYNESRTHVQFGLGNIHF